MDGKYYLEVKHAVLTKEERDVLALTAPRVCGKNLSNTEISQCLGISDIKVKSLIHQSCAKLKAHNRMEAIFFAVKRGEIRLDEIYSLDELAELWIALYPDALRMLIHLVREEFENKYFTKKEEQIIKSDRIYRRPDNILTNSERNVLILVGRGLTNKLIADRLGITSDGVRTSLYRICAKIGAHDRMEAVVLALKQGGINLCDIFSFDELVWPLTLLGTESLEKIGQLMSQKLVQEPVTFGV